jgi:NADH-quinone oxidoreductase subunit N
MSELTNFMSTIPEIFLVIMAIIFLLSGAFAKNNPTNVITLVAVISLIMAALYCAFGYDSDRLTTYAGMFTIDSFVKYCKVLLLVASALTLALSTSWFRNEKIDRPEYSTLIIFAVIGMMVMISASNLISLYLGIELQSLSLYILAAFHRESLRSTEAGLKYFILGSLASGMLLYGLSLIYGFAGTMGYDALESALSQNIPIGVIIGLIFVLSGLSFKLSAVPFHMWSPDVYEGAPTPVTSFFSVAPKIAAFALLIRFIYGPFIVALEQWQQVLVFISAASMIIGAFGAIVQKNIKRLMAYSSIGHVGYLLMGVSCGTVDGIRGVLVYLTIYVIMNIGSFSVIMMIRRKGRPLESIDELAGLSETHPAMSLALMIFMFSMAGIPPFAGFWAKWYVFGPAIAKGGIFIPLSILGVLTSVVGAYYYIRLIKIMYFDKAGEPLDKGMNFAVASIMTLCSLLIIVLIAPSVLVNFASSAASVLFGG